MERMTLDHLVPEGTAVFHDELGDASVPCGQGPGGRGKGIFRPGFGTRVFGDHEDVDVASRDLFFARDASN